MELNNTNYVCCSECSGRGCCDRLDLVGCGPIFTAAEWIKTGAEKLCNITNGFFIPHLIDDKKCPFFINNVCSIYEKRPIDCIIYPYSPVMINGELKIALLNNLCHSSIGWKQETTTLKRFMIHDWPRVSPIFRSKDKEFWKMFAITPKTIQKYTLALPFDLDLLDAITTPVLPENEAAILAAKASGRFRIVR